MSIWTSGIRCRHDETAAFPMSDAASSEAVQVEMEMETWTRPCGLSCCTVCSCLKSSSALCPDIALCCSTMQMRLQAANEGVAGRVGQGSHDAL